MRHNRLRELLDAGQPTRGTRLLSSWPTIVELVGHCGMFDYVERMGIAVRVELGVEPIVKQSTSAHGS